MCMLLLSHNSLQATSYQQRRLIHTRQKSEQLIKKSFGTPIPCMQTSSSLVTKPTSPMLWTRILAGSRQRSETFRALCGDAESFIVDSRHVDMAIKDGVLIMWFCLGLDPRCSQSTASVSTRLFDGEKLDIEDQLAVGRNAGELLAAIGKVGGDCQATLATDSHAGDTNVPALDDLASAGLEAERLALLVGCGGESVMILCRGSVFKERGTYSQRPCRP